MKWFIFPWLAVAVAAWFAMTHDWHGSPYDTPDQVWSLTELDGKPFAATATLTFPEAGKIAGKAPCNRYFGALPGTYPAFKPEKVGATRMACPDLQAETVFFQALAAMTTANVAGNTLTLTGPDGRNMVFTLASQSPD
jgi:heat shock protein HslJ